MVSVIQSGTFSRWLKRLRDRTAVVLINARLRAASQGHLGDTRTVGDGVWEMRIFHRPGYRLYFTRRGGDVIVLLCGGIKDSQRHDIARAKELAKDWR